MNSFLRSFDCSATENRDVSKCHYKNETFNIGDPFSSPELEASCAVGCSCRESHDEKSAKFECAHIDCPEFFNGPKLVRGKKCIYQYEENSCCIHRTVCGEFMTKISSFINLLVNCHFHVSGEDLNKLALCDVSGKSYYEGERIDTSRSCYSCTCGKGYVDKPVEENKHCHKINCHMEIHYSRQILEGCIPIYYKSDDCCPIDWRCPDSKTTVITDTTRKSPENDPLPKCTFGSLKMNVGDFLSPANDYDQCTLCSCKMPPLAHCIKTC